MHRPARTVAVDDLRLRVQQAPLNEGLNLPKEHHRPEPLGRDLLDLLRGRAEESGELVERHVLALDAEGLPGELGERVVGDDVSDEACGGVSFSSWYEQVEFGLTSDVVGVREGEGGVSGEALEDVDLLVDSIPDEVQGEVVEDARL